MFDLFVSISVLYRQCMILHKLGFFQTEQLHMLESHAPHIHADARRAIVRAKSDVFWENLAQHFAERVLGGPPVGDPIIVYGPMAPGAILEDASSLDAASVVVRTHIAAFSDPLNPPARVITFAVC